MLPERLALEVKTLAEEGFAVELTEADGTANAVFRGYSLPKGYSKSSSDLLLRLPLSYPNGRPDMFWLEADVVLANGGTPKSADHVETYLGRQWRRFSWHPQSWDPAVDDLGVYLQFVNARLAKGA